MTRFNLRAVMLCFLILTAAVTNSAKADLVITPTFDPSITSDSNHVAIENTINAAIQQYESTYSNNINVSIYFQEIPTGLGQSETELYFNDYSSFRSALAAQQAISGQADQATALAHLPNTGPGGANPVDGSSQIVLTTANMKALGIGSFQGVQAPDNKFYDGIIGLNTSITNPPNSPYSLTAVTQHEIDEVLGLGSGLNINGGQFVRAEDLYRYTGDGNGTRSFTTAGDNAFFSIDGTHNLVQFNQNGGVPFNPNLPDYGDWHTSGTVRVQDAFGTPGATPSLGVELTALDVIGYDRSNPVPEPSTLALLGLGGVGLAIGAIRRRRRQAAAV